MTRALVIGGTLFLGRALVDQLLARGDDVVIMHRGRSTPFGARVGEIHCDRNDVAAVRGALDGTQFDVVYDNVYDWTRGTSAAQACAAAHIGHCSHEVYTVARIRCTGATLATAHRTTPNSACNV